MSRLVVFWAMALGIILTPLVSAQPIVEFPIPTADSGPRGITSGPDGALWFTEFAANQIGRIATDGTITEFPLPAGSIAPRDITSGPDGALWFTEADDQGGFRIGRMTTAGVVTEFPLAPDHNPRLIVTGPDGNLWFSVLTHPAPAFTSFLVSRMTTAGAVTEFDESLDYVSGLTVGADGNIWTSRIGTTQHGHPTPSRIARLTPAGVLTTFYDSSFGQWILTSITAGPDGNLWFANNPNFYSEHYLVRMTTAGTLTGSFLLPDAGAGIASGSDGALWFLIRSLNEVGRSTTDGAMNFYSVPTAASGLLDMVAGPDGALWFTESAANQIGRLAPASPTPTPVPPLPTLTPTPAATPGPATAAVPALSKTGIALLVLLLGAAGLLFLRLR